jgi:hypothetical protein
MARWHRLLGLVFFLLIWAGEIAGTGDHPPPTGSAQAIAEFYVRYATEQRVGVYLQAAAGLVLVVLGACIAARFRDSMVSVLLVATSALGTAAMLWTYLALNGALAFGIGSDADPDVTRAVYQVRYVTDTIISFPAALLVGSIAVAVQRHHAARLWYVIASAVVAAVMLASGADLAREGFFAVNGDLSFLGFFVLFPLWAAISGFVLLGEGRAQRDPRPTPQ